MPNQRREFLQQAIVGVPAALATVNAFAAGHLENGQADSTQPIDSDRFREKLLAGLGGPWPEPCPLNVRVRSEKQEKGYRLLSLYYDAEPNDPIPAMLLIPDGVSEAKPVPAVAVWHQHNGRFDLGKVEPSGLAGNPCTTRAWPWPAKVMWCFAPTPCASVSARTRPAS